MTCRTTALLRGLCVSFAIFAVKSSCANPLFISVPAGHNVERTRRALAIRSQRRLLSESERSRTASLPFHENAESETLEPLVWRSHARCNPQALVGNRRGAALFC